MPNHPDGLTDIALACGMTRQVASAWRNGRRGMSRPAQMLVRLVAIHGFDALFHGTLAIPSDKPAQESAQAPKPKRTRKRKAK